MNYDLMKLPRIEQLTERFRDLSDAEWDRAMALAIYKQAEGLLEAAALIRGKEERGCDMTEIKEKHRGFFDIVRSFAYGKAIPELTMYYPDQQLIKLISNLPRPDQERVVREETFPVVVIGPDGNFTHYQRTALRMMPAERQQVFGGGTIRTEQEQKDFLAARRTRKGIQQRPERIGIGKMDYDRGGVLISNQFVPLPTLQEMVRALKRFGYKGV